MLIPFQSRQSPDGEPTVMLGELKELTTWRIKE